MNDRPSRVRLFAVAVAAAMFALLPIRAASGAERFLVRSWQSEDGLPSNIVRAVAQAADGYLWVATAEGVVRFDGVRFSQFMDESDVALARRSPRTLFALQNGEVWIATNRGGLLRWDRKRFVTIWDDWDPATEGRLDYVTQVASDGAGGTFIERGDKTFHFVDSGPPRPLEKTPELVEKVRAAVAAQWQRVATAPPGSPLELLDDGGHLWSRTSASGLEVSEVAGQSEPVALPEFAPGARITALMEDRERNIWVATNGSGLFQVRPSRVSVFAQADGLSDRSVLPLLEDRSGALWAASKGGGIDRIVQGRVTHFQIGRDDAAFPISALCEDRDGTLWVARFRSSVYRWQGEGFQLATSNAMPVKRVSAMASDAAGRMWFADQHGLAAWADGALTRYDAELGNAAKDIAALAFDGSGTLWAGTFKGALYRGRDGHFEKAGELDSRAVSALLPDEDGAVWVTTLGSGLFRWTDGRIARFSEREGLPEDRLTCVLDDRADHLWLGSLGGIFRVAKSELAEVAAQRRSAARWLQFDRADGMLSRECTGGFQPAGWRGRDGALWFPTVNGIAKVQPATVELNKLPPPVVIEEARVYGRAPQLPAATLRAGPGRSRLEFRYTALSFSAPEKVRFRTQLEGLDDEWHDAGTLRIAAYEAVPPGSYRFRVLATNNDGLWSETGASLAVVVIPHLWETTSFKIATALGAGALAFGIGVLISRARLRGRMLRIQAETSREKERARIARDLHDDLGASLTEISILTQLAAEESSRDGLHEIASKARGCVSALDEIVWAVNPRHDTLASLADYLAASTGEFLESAGIALRLDIPQNLPAVPLDADQRHGLFLAVREAVNNAVKHSGASEVRLCLSTDDGELEIVVEDNGRGLSQEASDSSEGLRNMRERMATIGGACLVESSTTGTRVRFSLPLAKH